METNPASRKPILLWLLASQALALLSLIFWLFAAGTSFMAFDSGQNPSLVVWLLLIAVWTYPVWPIVLSVAAWRAYARKKDKLAVVLTTLTFLPALVLVLSIVLPAIFSRPAPL